MGTSGHEWARVVASLILPRLTRHVVACIFSNSLATSHGRSSKESFDVAATCSNKSFDSPASLSHALFKTYRTSVASLSSVFTEETKHDLQRAGSNRRAFLVTASLYLEWTRGIQNMAVAEEKKSEVEPLTSYLRNRFMMAYGI